MLCAILQDGIPDQYLAQQAGWLVRDILLGARQLQIHVAIDRYKCAFVLDLTPLQANENWLVDEVLQHRPRVDGYETHGGGISGGGGLRSRREGCRDSFDVWSGWSSRPRVA